VLLVRSGPEAVRAEPALSSSLEVNQDSLSPNRNLTPLTTRLHALGRLEVGGCELSELASTYGTPLYVLDEGTLRASCRAYWEALAAHYPGPALAPPAPALQVDQQPDQDQHHHQRHLIGPGIGHEDVGDEVGQVGHRVDDAQPEMDPSPGTPALGVGGIAGGIGDQQDRPEREQEVDQHGGEKQRQLLAGHMALDLRREAVEEGHEAQVHVEQHRQQPGEPEAPQPQGMVDRAGCAVHGHPSAETGPPLDAMGVVLSPLRG